MKGQVCTLNRAIRLDELDYSNGLEGNISVVAAAVTRVF